MQTGINRYRQWQDRHSVLFGKLLLLWGLQKYGYPKDCLTKIRFDKHKRPYIDSEIDFNISHSGKYVICAISDTLRVGIDVEKNRNIDLMDYKNHMHPAHWKEIRESAEINNAFFNFWTKIESVLKADGKGIASSLREIHIQNDTAVINGTSWYIRDIELDPGYNCSLTTNTAISEISMTEMKYSEC